MRFSIIIPAYNAGGTIRELLESVFRQVYTDFEVIVVNDNSSDNTREILSEFPVKALSLNRNKGPSYARNYGAKNAKGEYLVFFDADVILNKDVMGKFAKRLDGGAVKALIGRYHEEPANKGFIPEYKALQESVWYLRIRGEEASPFTPYVGAIERKLFMDIGGFDEGYSRADVEDYKFTIKLSDKAKIYIDKHIQVKHHFPGFKRLVKSYFRRCFLWTEVFLEQRRFDSNTTTPKQGFAHAAYAASVLCLILSLFVQGALAPAVLSFTAALYMERDFIKILFLKKGFFFGIRAVILNILLSVVIIASAVMGFVYYGWRVLFRPRR